MKVTKINENQVRCVINREDIISRNTNLIELFYNKDKMQSLFTDMMEEIHKEYGDAYQDSGIMMEAIVTLDGSIVITLTKQGKEEAVQENTNTEINEDYLVYSFDNLPMVMQASTLLKEFIGKNTLYKDSRDDKYYIVFSKEVDDENLINTIYFLNDYGKEENLSNVSIAYLMEHYSVIVRESAVQTLAVI